MTAATFSVLLFGLVHPGSKLILDTGIGLFHFCLLYSAFRLFLQLPIVIVKKHYLIASKTQILLLGAMGLVGAGLQLAEFKGISDGLPVSLVTFLLYSYPIWSAIFSSVINGETLTKESFFKIGLSFVGLFLILMSQSQNLKFSVGLIFPIIASILMALWICLSNLLKKKGCGSWSISFYYDLFVFITLATLTFSGQQPGTFAKIQSWLFQDSNALLILTYAILLGVVPNLLFYKASQNLSAMTASLILLFEPVISSFVSSALWNEQLTNRFIMGAFLLLTANISYKNLFTFNFIKKESL